MARQHWIFGLSSFALGAVVIAVEARPRLPGDHTGYEPVQPMAYSHRLHAGELQIPCLYCHYGAQTSRHAGIPAASVCMNCHATVSASNDVLQTERELALKENRDPRRIVSNEIAKLYDTLALDTNLHPIPGRTPQSTPWVRVNQLPDFVYFDHRAHVTRGVACEACHGAVQAMERVRQESSFSMGWCVACHRANSSDPGRGAGGPGDPRVTPHVSTDCVICHF